MKKPIEIQFPPQLRDEPDAADLRRAWRALGPGVPSPLPARDTDRAWDALSHRLGLASPGTRGSHTVSRGGLRRLLLRVAAVLVLALGVTATWYAVPVTRTAHAGEQRSLLLPDGSAVELNAGSTLRYRRGFTLLPGVSAQSRSVRLEGEAFFSVEPGVRPFRVEAGPAEVRVLGTRFNVRARSPDAGEGARVEVEEGRVEVWSAGGSSSLILTAGEAARVLPGSRRPAREELVAERIGLWRTGGLTVVDEPLSSILGELSLRYGVRISLLDPDSGANRLSVFYPELGSLESVLSDLATQQDLRYRRTSDGWELF